MEEINLKDLFNCYRNKLIWIILAVVFAAAIGNTYTILTRVPMYKSDTTIVLVSENKNNTYNSTELQLNKNLVSTYSEIIKSRKVLEPVIANLKLKDTYTELKEKVTVTAVQNTEIIKVTVANKKKGMAKKIANEIADVFTQEIQKIYKLNNVSVVDKAVEATNPYNVNYLKDNVIYVTIGLIISCGIIFLIFYFDTTIKSGDEIEEKLGLQVIGIVPKVEKE